MAATPHPHFRVKITHLDKSNGNVIVFVGNPSAFTVKDLKDRIDASASSLTLATMKRILADESETLDKVLEHKLGSMKTDEIEPSGLPLYKMAA